jgi:hypothetical protein
MPANPKPCPRCGKFDVSIRTFAHKVFCNNCKNEDGTPLDITEEVSEWHNKHEIGG